MLACALFNEQNKVPILLSIITWFVLRKQNVQSEKGLFRTKKHEKIHKICRDDLRAFALRNYLEGYKINKPLSRLAGTSEDNALGWKICRQNFTVALEASLLGLQFIFRTIFQPWSLSSDTPAAERVLFSNCPGYIQQLCYEDELDMKW